MKKSTKIIIIALLIILAVIVRLQHTHQTDFDSYWLYGQGESIQIHKSALWVFHPASLFGYYPLSYPSGVPFFLAMFSTMTGIDMNTTVLITSIILGLLITFLVYALAKKIFKNEIIAFLSALVVTLSPIIVDYTAFNAGGRVLIMFFYIPMVWCMLHFYETRRWTYLMLSVMLLVFSFFVHRTGQLTAIFIVAFIAAWAYMSLPKIWHYIKNHKIFQKIMGKRYEKSKYYLLLDVGILIFVLAIIKISDLIARDRFGINLQRKVLDPAEELLASATSYAHLIPYIVGGIIIIILGIIVYFKFIKKKKIIKPILKFFHNQYHKLFENPQKYFIYTLLVITAYIFFRQFFGESFYSPSLTEFYETELISGRQPWAIFLNMLINYTTSVSPLFLLMFLGFVIIIFKKEKKFLDWFMIFTFIAFSGILLDKRYVRLFFTPIFAIFIAYGTYSFYEWLKKKANGKKHLVPSSYMFVLFVTFILIFSIFVPTIRTTALGDTSGFDQIKPYWDAGLYLRTLDCDCSTITTDELVAGVTIFASSGVPGASFNIYYFVPKEKIKPVALTSKQIKDRLMRGDKVANIWILPDWIFGGQYYVGRHALYLFDRPFYDEINKIIISDYKEKYYIHDQDLKKNKFLESIEPVKNLIYSNPKTTIYEIDKGRT